MINDEILAGIKTAIAHGFSLDEAVASFVNAGNNPQEVREAASFVSRGVSPLPLLSKSTETAVQKEQEIPQQKSPEASKKVVWLLITLAIIVALGLVFLIFFKDKFLGLIIDPIFP